VKSRGRGFSDMSDELAMDSMDDSMTGVRRKRGGFEVVGKVEAEWEITSRT